MTSISGTNSNPLTTQQAEGSFFRTCSDFLMTLVDKVQEVFMTIFHLITFGFFSSSESIDPARVTVKSDHVSEVPKSRNTPTQSTSDHDLQRSSELSFQGGNLQANQNAGNRAINVEQPQHEAHNEENDGANIAQQQQPVVPDDANINGVPGDHQQDLQQVANLEQQEQDGANAQHQLGVVNPHNLDNNLNPDGVDLVVADDANINGVPGDHQQDLQQAANFEHQEQDAANAQHQLGVLNLDNLDNNLNPDGVNVAALHMADDDVVIIDQNPEDEASREHDSADRLQQLQNRLGQIRQRIHANDDDFKLAPTPVQPDFVIREQVIADRALSHPQKALSLIAKVAGACAKTMTAEQLNGMIDQAETFYQDHEQLEDSLRRAGLVKTNFDLSQHDRYLVPRNATLRIAVKGACQSTYFERIHDAVIGVMMKSQSAAGAQASAIINIQDRVYGLYVEKQRTKYTYTLLIPNQATFVRFSSAKHVANYITSTLEKESFDSDDFVYSVVPLEKRGQDAPAQDDFEVDEKQPIVGQFLTKLKPDEAEGGFYSACQLAVDLMGQIDLNMDARAIHGYLHGGSASLSELGPVNIERLGQQGVVLASLGDPRTKRAWADSIDGQFRQKNEPQFVVLSNHNFTYSHLLAITQNGEYLLWSPNAEPAEFSSFDNLASLKSKLGARATKYSAYTISAPQEYQRPTDLNLD